MISVHEAREKADKAFNRRYASWAARIAWDALSPGQDAPMDFDKEDLGIPLHPPTEREALDGRVLAKQWVDDWSAVEGSLPFGASVVWEERRWPSVGRQRVPARLSLCTADAIAGFSGSGGLWDMLKGRVTQYCALCMELPDLCCPSSVPEGISRVAAEIIKASDCDWTLALEAVAWMACHDTRAYYIREMPIAGIDTKWVAAHRKLVFSLVACITGGQPVFKEIAPQKRVHVLDERLAPGGLVDFQATAQGLSQLSALPDKVIICENLATVLALPCMSGTIAIHGGGYGVTDLAGVDWLHDVPLYYWGDLDTHGFAILHALRTSFPHAVSVLMDKETLETHRVYCVEEPTPVPAQTVLEHLTAAERETMQALFRDGRHDRLEQERISWSYALEELHRVLDNRDGTNV